MVGWTLVNFCFFKKLSLSLSSIIHPHILLDALWLQVKSLTTNIQLILDSLRASSIVEVHVSSNNAFSEKYSAEKNLIYVLYYEMSYLLICCQKNDLLALYHVDWMK